MDQSGGLTDPLTNRLTIATVESQLHAQKHFLENRAIVTESSNHYWHRSIPTDFS